MSIERAKRIKLIIFDVDGVMTDGTIWLFPAPAGASCSTGAHAEKMAGEGGYAIHSETVIEAKGFNAHDGTGFSLARLGGIKTGLITKRISETVALRARDLKMDYAYQGIADKNATFQEILKKEGITAEEVCYVGDDIIDLPVMRRCGLAIAVPNGREEVTSMAHWVTPHAGGHGAVRDAIEYILRAQGKLERVMEEYVLGKRVRRSGKKS
jgi:3-deoxy-D-manno-octulosonate 8-phosphate phosphatase (KDO 8-P phosphatase)